MQKGENERENQEVPSHIDGLLENNIRQSKNTVIDKIQNRTKIGILKINRDITDEFQRS